MEKGNGLPFACLRQPAEVSEACKQCKQSKKNLTNICSYGKIPEDFHLHIVVAGSEFRSMFFGLSIKYEGLRVETELELLMNRQV